VARLTQKWNALFRSMLQAFNIFYQGLKGGLYARHMEY